jgi:hypothetical protein
MENYQLIQRQEMYEHLFSEYLGRYDSYSKKELESVLEATLNITDDDYAKRNAIEEILKTKKW